MSASLIKIDIPTLKNKLRWAPADEGAVPRYAPGYLGLYTGFDFSDVTDTTISVNRKMSLQLDCSVEPNGACLYHVLLAVNPELFEYAEVSAPTILLPGSARIRPTIHLRGLRKFDLRDLAYAATIHLID